MFGFFGPAVPGIAPQDVQERLASTTVPVMLDVREPAEFARGRVPKSLAIPLASLAGRIQELPKDRDIIVVCQSGARSAGATRLLREAGRQAYNMTGGMAAWRGPVER